MAVPKKKVYKRYRKIRNLENFFLKPTRNKLIIKNFDRLNLRGDGLETLKFY